MCIRDRLRGKDALPPLYTLQDASDCLQQVRGIEYDREFAPRVGVRARFRDAGHILGSAIIEVWVTEYGYPTKLVFSGDLGQPGRPILRDPTPIEDADILVIESTYGNRQHKDFSATEEEMIGIVEKTLFERGGNVIVPAFAVGRTQEILYHLHRLTCEGRLRDVYKRQVPGRRHLGRLPAQPGGHGGDRGAVLRDRQARHAQEPGVTRC